MAKCIVIMYVYELYGNNGTLYALTDLIETAYAL